MWIMGLINHTPINHPNESKVPMGPRAQGGRNEQAEWVGGTGGQNGRAKLDRLSFCVIVNHIRLPRNLGGL